MSNGSLRLHTLGEFSLRRSGGPGERIPVQRQKLALLAFLALTARPIPRDTLIAMFWGDEGEDRARHSLSNALSSLRRILGAGAIAARRDVIALSPDVVLAVDVVEFEQACERGDCAEALARYGGPFLEGVYAGRSNDFEDWRSRRAAREEQLFLDACRMEVDRCAAGGRWPEALNAARRWMRTAPDSAAAQLAFLLAGLRIADAGGAAATLREFHALTARLGVPLEAPVTAAVDQLAGRVRREETAAAPALAEPGSSLPRSPRLTLAAALAGLSVLAVAALLVFRLGGHSTVAQATMSRPLVLVAGLQATGGDTATAWLGDGMQQMISADLARSPAVEVVAPARLRDVLARAQLGAPHSLTAGEARDLAGRVGATWLVTGGVTRGPNGLLVLDLSVRQVGADSQLALFTVTGTDPMSVADQAAARLLSRASAALPGPHLAETETANLTAYQHYVRATQAEAEGRDADVDRELDAAIAADSGFVSAIVERMRRARGGDPAALARLSHAFRRAAAHATEWDQLDQALHESLHNGENPRAEAVGRELVARFPHDPRAYTELADVLTTHGAWAAADTVLQQALSLDSLALMAGNGPCAPCAGLGGLIALRAGFEDQAGAEQAARRWVALQPSVPLAWSELADVLAYEGRYDEAIDAAQRALWLGGEASAPVYDGHLGEILLLARRYGQVDTLVDRWRTDRRPALRSVAADLEALLQRERGQYGASARTIAGAVRRDSSLFILELMRANSLARLGQTGVAAAVIDTVIRSELPDMAPLETLSGDRARKFSWERTLRADAVAPAADTSVLRAIADSVRRISTRSYYGRDWRLAYHIDGLIDERAGRWELAARDFARARWGHAGWTRTNVELARADLRLGRPQEAIQVLRDAYRGPLDAMGRYVPRSELDWWMARAFSAAAEPDSARRYAGYVRAAWRDADTPVRARLEELRVGPGDAAASNLLR